MGNFQNLNQMKITEKPTIKASWLGSHEYCEYKWYLENVLKEDIPIVRAMIIGKEVHKIKEDEFKKVAKPTTPKEFLKSKLYTITKEITLEKEFNNFILVGKIDELGVDVDYLYVIDDKPRAKPYLGTKRQIWAYCILVKEFIREDYPEYLNKKIFAILRDRDSDNEVWKEEFSKNNVIDVLNIISRMLFLIKGKSEPIPNDIPGKCRACVLHKQEKCSFSCG